MNLCKKCGSTLPQYGECYNCNYTIKTYNTKTLYNALERIKDLEKEVEHWSRSHDDSGDYIKDLLNKIKELETEKSNLIKHICIMSKDADEEVAFGVVDYRQGYAEALDDILEYIDGLTQKERMG